MLKNVLRWFSGGLAVAALAAGAGLLICDAKMWAFPVLSVAAISAGPLLLIGTSFLIVQLVIRPRWSELLKNVLLAGTFLLWGTIQLMPQNYLAQRLGNVVIVLYVLDLAWTTFSSLNSQEED
jgi:hypothetical protein